MFDLLSVNTNHYDFGENSFWQGWNGGSVVASASTNASNTLFNFSGFTNLDKVTLTITGFWDDPSFDDLTYQSSVPEPSAIALMGLGLLGFVATRRRKIQA